MSATSPNDAATRRRGSAAFFAGLQQRNDETLLSTASGGTRRQREAVLLAILATTAVYAVRHRAEVSPWYWSEIAVVTAIVALAWGGLRRGALLLLLVPLFFDLIGGAIGWPVPHEMAAITGLAMLGLVFALYRNDKRWLSLAVICSGFVVLFGTAINDDPRSVWVATLWFTICIWHLVANHWERLAVCMPDQVRPSVSVRPVTVGLAVLLSVLGIVAVRGRFTDSRRLGFGFMPTSGGDDWHDPRARSGVGDGDAAVAARDFADSFGAVDSDVFLESQQQSLFDMFSESLGKPFQVKRNDPAQALTNRQLLENHGDASKSEQGDGSFSVQRSAPPQHRHLRDAKDKDNAILQWVGPTGIRLAMQRFEDFDGVEWTATETANSARLVARQHGSHTWIVRSDQAVDSSNTDPRYGAAKLLRLQSSRIPTPQRTDAVQIKDIDRVDFFGITADDSWQMPRHEQIPALTIIAMQWQAIQEDHLITELALTDREPVDTDWSHRLLSETVTAWTGGIDDRYAQLQTIVQRLRRDFTFDRQGIPDADDPLGDFLQSRRGGDHWFATTAALMARQIGLESRLVTGFYVPARRLDSAAGQTPVTAGDVHVWCEIRLADGTWFEIEPTPGYQVPDYRPSWRLWATRAVARHWSSALVIAVLVWLLYRTRWVWLDLILSLLWLPARLLNRKQRIRIAVAIVQCRANWLGVRRPPGMPQRDWLIGLAERSDREATTVRAELVTRFCNAADRVCFAGPRSAGGLDDDQEAALANHLVAALTIRNLRRSKFVNS